MSGGDFPPGASRRSAVAVRSWSKTLPSAVQDDGHAPVSAPAPQVSGAVARIPLLLLKNKAVSRLPCGNAFHAPGRARVAGMEPAMSRDQFS